MERGSKVHPMNKTDGKTVKTDCFNPSQDEKKGNIPPVIELALDTGKSKQALLAESLKPLFFWLSVCGITWNPYCTTSSRRSSSFARRCYSIFVLFLFLQQLAVTSFCYSRHNSDREIVLIISSQMDVDLALFIWFSGLVFPKYMTAFVRKYDHARSCIRFLAPIRRIKKILNIVTLASVCTIVSGITFWYGVLIGGVYKSEVACLTNPFEGHIVQREIMLSASFVASALIFLTIHIFLILFITVCILLKREFDACSKGLLEMTAKHTDEDVLEVFSKQHGHLCHLTEMTGSFLSLYVGAVYFYSIVDVCFVIYICLFSPDNYFTLNTVGLLLYFAVLHLVPVTYSGMKLHNAAHAPLRILHDLEGRTLNDRVIGLVTFLTNKLYQNEIGISVMGLMIITKSTVFTVIGTLLTYIFIVVQFKPSPTSPLIPPANSTVSP